MQTLSGKEIVTGNAAEKHDQLPLQRVLAFFVLLTAISLILRIFYAGHLYQDDGFWFTAGEEVLRGKALYREIYFDKPPALPLVYALLFKAFGAHILTIRLFTVFYSVAVSAVLYRFGARLYSREVGAIAAAMFVIFSTTYTTGHVQGLNTDFLMILPYSAAAYLLVRSVVEGEARRRARWLAVCGGLLAGIAFQVNPKGVFALAFFAVLLIISVVLRDRSSVDTCRMTDAALLFALAFAGFAAASLPFLGYLAAERSLSAYWQYVWAWGARYASYYPAWEVFVSALRQSAAYFALNNTLLAGVIVLITTTFFTNRARFGASPKDRQFQADLILLIWFATSYAGLAVGGRFFGHYFFQIMPSLCLIGARGLTHLNSALGSRISARRWVLAALIVGFAVTMIRFHARTAVLAADWIRETKGEVSTIWYHERLNNEERRAAAVVRELPDKEESAAQVALEGIRQGGPRTREPIDGSDYLFVWGYRPELYYWSGLLPASRYLSTQPLTGIPADVHYFESEHRLLFDEAVTAQARDQLVRDLEQTRPKYIVDELGMFNSELSLEDYSELHAFMEDYKFYGTTDRFIIYRRREKKK